MGTNKSSGTVPRLAAIPSATMVWRLSTNSLLLSLALLLAACGRTTLLPNASATSTAEAAQSAATATGVAIATRAASPVQVAITATVRGTAEQHNVAFVMAVTVTNRTNATIHLAGTCDHPAISIGIANTAGGFEYVSNEGVLCSPTSSTDLRPGVGPGASYTWHYTYYLSNRGNLQPGRYSVIAQLHHWHQGTIQQLFQTPLPLNGTASSEQIFVTVS